MPYPALNSAFDALYPKGIRAYWKGAFVKELRTLITALDIGPQVPEVTATMHLYPINGACHRVAADDTAFAYRDATFGMVILAGWHDPAKDPSGSSGFATTTPRLRRTRSRGATSTSCRTTTTAIPDNYRENYDRLSRSSGATIPATSST